MAMVALNFLSLLFMNEALPMRASVSEHFDGENYSNFHPVENE